MNLFKITKSLGNQKIEQDTIKRIENKLVFILEVHLSLHKSISVYIVCDWYVKPISH